MRETVIIDNYRWSHGLLLAAGAAPWGGGEIGEINRVGLRLRQRMGDDRAWFEEWTRMAESVEVAGRRHGEAKEDATTAAYLFRAAHYYHVGERFLQPKSADGLAAYQRGVECFREAAQRVRRPRAGHDLLRWLRRHEGDSVLQGHSGSRPPRHRAPDRGRPGKRRGDSLPQPASTP